MNRLREQVEHLELKPYRCYHCHGVIGLTTSNLLYVGAAKFIKSVTMQCGYCDKLTFWKPSAEILTDKH